MPYITNGNAKIYYDDSGNTSDPAILTSHGVCENGSYWALTGVSENLVQAGFRVVNIDMRGHGRSVPIDPDQDPGYNSSSVASDFAAVADQLDIEKFHLLTHATGGMAGLQYAIDHSDRLLSLMSTDTGSATAPSDKFCSPEYDNHSYRVIDCSNSQMASAYEKFTVAQMMERARKGDGGPFLNRLNTNSNADYCWKTTEEILTTGNPVYYSAFQRSFYTNPDPQVTGLKGISCPCLALLGEHDVLFIKPSGLLVRCIPNVKHVVMSGLGHMTAIEDPAGTSKELIGFLKSVALGRI